MKAQHIREGGPPVCINCGDTLHRKSEHYCSQDCQKKYKAKNAEAPGFLSKWKIRKTKEEKDPLIKNRKRTRQRSHELLQKGIIKRKPCVVCNSNNAIMHHEDYHNPYNVIWLCEMHHKEYHDGKIGLFNGKLWWNPARLIPRNVNNKHENKKYELLQQQFRKQKQGS